VIDQILAGPDGKPSMSPDDNIARLGLQERRPRFSGFAECEAWALGAEAA